MGKKKLEKIDYIHHKKTRNVTYCKRKKGLLKKAVELSILCDISVCVLIYDKSRQRCSHFMNDPEENLLNYFSEQCNREYFSNLDYIDLGGHKDQLSATLLARIGINQEIGDAKDGNEDQSKLNDKYHLSFLEPGDTRPAI